MNFTTIESVKEEAFCHFQNNGKKESFIEALQNIEKTSGFTQFFHMDELMPVRKTEPDFEKYMSGIYIYTDHIINNRNRSEIIEDIAIPYGKDVFVYQHLPYVNDGFHEHNYFEINYVYRGKCIQLIDGKSLLQEGEFSFIAPHTRHNLMAEENSLVICLLVRQSTFEAIFWSFMLRDDLLAAFFKKTLFEGSGSHYVQFQTNRSEAVKETVQNIVREANNSDNYSNVCCISYLQLLFSMLLRKYCNSAKVFGDNGKTNSAGDFSLLLEYLNRNYKTVTLGQLASIFNYSESYLSKLIKKNLNRSFVHVLQDIRIKHAEEELINTSRSIEEISEDVGYSSADYFSRYFKSIYKMAPSEYRNNKLRELSESKKSRMQDK